MTLKPSDIEALVELFGKSDWDELHVEIDGEEILLSNDSRRSTAGAAPASVAAAGVAAAAPTTPAPIAPAAANAAPPVAGAVRGANWVAIKAANLGTYYRAASPDAAPYVSVGTSVSAESEVCMIEVMKLFTTIRAGVAGVVREICVEDGQMVEYGQDLMWIEPV